MDFCKSGLFSKVLHICGYLSIFASIAIWFFFNSEDSAHAERFGIFVGLWAPTFFILSERYKNGCPIKE